MNYLIWNIIPGYIYSKPPKKMLYLQEICLTRVIFMQIMTEITLFDYPAQAFL